MEQSIEILIVAGGGILIALLGICCKYFYKIKISDCSVCYGCLKIRRDVDEEANNSDEKVSDDIPSAGSSRRMPAFRF